MSRDVSQRKSSAPDLHVSESPAVPAPFACDSVPVAVLLKMAAPYNPRRISARDLESLIRSMTTFGVVQPIVVNTTTRHIVGGHQRVVAASKAGLEALPVYYVTLDLAHEKLLNVALNRIGGEWDETLLASVLADLKGLDADVALTGFSDEEIAKLTAAAALPDFKPIDESDVSELDKTKPKMVTCPACGHEFIR